MISLAHPKSLWILSVGKMWDTFSYFGTQTILALYLIHVFHLSRNNSYLMYGAYATFAYAFPIVGGIVADRWIGSKNALVVGCLLNIIGNLMLVSLDRYWFCLGLAITLIGTGFYKSNAIHLVGAAYQAHNHHKKETGFTVFYLAMNIGGVLAPLVYGFIVYSVGWNYGFLASALGVFIGLIWLLINWKLIESGDSGLPAPRKLKLSLLGIGIILACLLVSLPFYIPTFINPLICTVFIASFGFYFLTIFKYTGENRRHLLALFSLSFLSMFYFAAGLQVGTTITLFIQDKIQQGVVHTALPASTFSMLYCLFVLLLAPCATYLWRYLRLRNINLSTPTRLAIGVGLATLGMGVFAVAAATNLIMVGIILGVLLLSAGELIITPAAYTAISNLSPPGMKSTMMACWLLFIALGGYVSSLLASVAHAAAQKISFHYEIYFGEFLFIALFMLTITVIIVFAIPKLSRMMR